MQLSGKVVLITGASQGVGAACAEAFARRGAKIALTARSREALERAAAGGLAVAGDVTDGEFRRRLVETVLERYGAIDVLVNNAGVGLYVPSWQARLDDAAKMFELNFLAAVGLAQLVVPTMRAAGRGSIVNVGSIGGAIPLPWMTLYSASKAALESWTDGLRMELRGDSIHVMKVSPGYVQTGFQDHAIGGAAPERLRRAKRFGITAGTCAEAIVRGVERGSRHVVTPGIGRLFAAAYRIAPSLVEWRLAEMGER